MKYCFYRRQQAQPSPLEALQSSKLTPCIDFDSKMQQDVSLALESAEICGAVLSECQQALDASLSRLTYANVLNSPQAVAALEARQLMIQIEALEDAWFKARKSADRAEEVSFKLSDLVQVLGKENATLKEQVP
jgi:hypothetical protein